MRDSNIELARIVAMVAIVIYHFVCHGVFMDNWPLTNEIDIEHGQKLLALASSFVMFGTDLFALVSGFFRIRLRWKTIVGLWFLCLFYNLMNVVVKADFSMSAIGHCFFISSTQQWYFAAYLWMVLLSPIINAGINSLSKNALCLVCLLCMLLSGFSGWFLENNNISGHTFDQIITMYIVGAGLKAIGSFKYIKLYWFPIVYVSMGVFSIAFISIYSERGLTMLFYHNNPFTMVAAVAVFCFFHSISVKSNKIVNKVASCTPAVLLLSDMVLNNRLYFFVHNDYLRYNLSGIFVLHMVGLLIVIFVASFCIDIIRQFLFKAFFSKIADTLDSSYPIPIK